MIHVFTSVNVAYLTNARILAESIKSIHPEWEFTLLFNDRTPPGINWATEIFDNVFFAHWLPIKDFRRWAFQYSVVEFCTATKGLMAEILLDRSDCEIVVYLDPDTVIFSRFKEMMSALVNNDVILTPHVTDIEADPEGVQSHEIAALKHGTFNLGFFAIKNSAKGRRYLRWWAERTRDYSHIDLDLGLFTDQKWCNIAPYMFEGIYIMCNRNYNVATWNITGRKISKDSLGCWRVNREPLRFYHFSGFGHDFEWANQELGRFDSDGSISKVWDFYKAEYAKYKFTSTVPWFWGVFENGVPITKEDRLRYQSDLDLQKNFRDPFCTECYRALRFLEPDYAEKPAAAPSVSDKLSPG